GFSENRITDYQFSSMSLQKYTHYKLTLPNQDCNPLRSGNYLLKVYLDSDTSQLVLTRRLLIQEPLVTVSGNIKQPISPKLFYTAQKVNFSLNVKGLNINNPYDQLKIYILQNFRWDNCISGLQPMYLKGDVIEYNTENDCIFPGGKEWRWTDLRNFHLRTARAKNQPDTSMDNNPGNQIRVPPDYNRAGQQYEYFKDVNGQYLPAMLDNYDPNIEGDYARVTFSFPTQQPFAGYNLYLFGEMTGYELTNDNRLTYNGAKGAYECTLYLKQGIYSYIYGVVDLQDPAHKFNTELTEGNSWEAENNYTILVYYRALGARNDQLVNATTWNSLTNR
ncbi:MAG TPA: type IX secretion system plug protein domain-containing protein, partial [Chitinophaga sp.]